MNLDQTPSSNFFLPAAPATGDAVVSFSPTSVLEPANGTSMGTSMTSNVAMPSAPEIISMKKSGVVPRYEKTTRTKQVRFKLPPTIVIDPEEEEERNDVGVLMRKRKKPGREDNDTPCLQTTWYSRSEIQEIQLAAKQKAERFRGEKQDWIKRICDDLSLLDPSSTGAKNCGTTTATTIPPTLKRLIAVHQPPDDFDLIRGLHIDPSLINHRLQHTKRVLLIQKKCYVNRVSARESLIRMTSIQTSRSSRIWARWLAYYDSMDVIAMIQGRRRMSKMG